MKNDFKQIDIVSLEDYMTSPKLCSLDKEIKDLVGFVFNPTALHRYIKRRFGNSLFLENPTKDTKESFFFKTDIKNGIEPYFLTTSKSEVVLAIKFTEDNCSFVAYTKHNSDYSLIELDKERYKVYAAYTNKMQAWINRNDYNHSASPNFSLEKDYREWWVQEKSYPSTRQLRKQLARYSEDSKEFEQIQKQIEASLGKPNDLTQEYKRYRQAKDFEVERKYREIEPYPEIDVNNQTLYPKHYAVWSAVKQVVLSFSMPF